MPSFSFVQLKNKIRTMHAEAAAPISSRESHRLAQGIVLTEYAALFNTAADAYDRDCSDETGEMAVNNVLVQYLTKYGTLTAPRIQVLAA